MVLLFLFFMIFSTFQIFVRLQSFFSENPKSNPVYGIFIKNFIRSFPPFRFLSDFIHFPSSKIANLTWFIAFFNAEITGFRNLSDYILLFQKCVRFLSEICLPPFRNLSDYFQIFVRIKLKKILIL